MKRFCSLLLAIIISLSCVAAFAAEIPDELPVGVLSASAKLYKKASTKDGTVTTLKANTEVEIIGETKSFYRVVADNRAGYILKKYIDIGLDVEPTSSSSESSSSTKNLGTRKNPAKVGDTVTVNMETYVYGSGTLKMKLVSVTRGYAAYNQVMQWNMFNSAPSAGKEYALLLFEVTLVKDFSSSDKGYEINTVQFDYADHNYAVDDDIVFGVLKPALDYRLYEGTTVTGYVLKECEPGKDGYAVYMDKVWFKF